MRRLDRIFIGATPTEHRKFVTHLLRHLRERGIRKVNIPCCGQFALAQSAIRAGFKPTDIVCSDISFFSSALGVFYSGRPIADLPFTLAEEIELDGKKEQVLETYESQPSESRKLAYLFWLIKIKQLRPSVYFEKVLYDELLYSRESQIGSLAKKIDSYQGMYQGIRYEALDMRKVLLDDHDISTVVIVNPPAYKKGYEKMFPIEDFVTFPVEVSQFNLSEEYFPMLEQSIARDNPFLWYRQYDLARIDPEMVCFAKEDSPGRFDFWLFTKPNMLEGFRNRKTIVFRKSKDFRPYKNLPIWGPEDEIREDMKVQFVRVPLENALYYRDLWAHRLGNTSAEMFFLLILDGKVFGTVGFHAEKVRRLVEDRIFESFGFSAPSWRYPNKNRLLMTLITCEQMGKTIAASMSNKNRIYSLRGMHTTCLTKYRKNKLNNGLLELVSREKLENGMYRLKYQCDYRPETFQQSLKRYLDEFQATYRDKLRPEVHGRRGQQPEEDG